MEEMLSSLAVKLQGIGADAQDSDEVRVKKTLLVAASLLIILATALWGAVHLYFDEPLAAAISFLYSVITLLSILALAYSRQYGFFIFSQILLGLILPFLYMVVMGGYEGSSAVVLWSIISPLGAMIFFDSRQALRT